MELDLKLNLPQKLRGLFWILQHGKLLTNEMRTRRKFTVNASCERYDYMKEDILTFFGTTPELNKSGAISYRRKKWHRTLILPFKKGMSII